MMNIFVMYFPCYWYHLVYLNSSSDYFTSLTVNIQNVLVSCFLIALLCAHVRSTFHYRTASGLHNPSQTLRTFCYWRFYLIVFLISLFIETVHGYSGFQPIRYLTCHPLILLLTFLRDREVWALFSIQNLHTV